jgi:hypothetical protein
VLVERFFFLLNAAFAMVILDLISHVHLPSFVNMIPKYLKHSTFSICFWSWMPYLWEKSLQYPLNRRLGGPQSWSGCFRKKSLDPPGRGFLIFINYIPL